MENGQILSGEMYLSAYGFYLTIQDGETHLSIKKGKDQYMNSKIFTIKHIEQAKSYLIKANRGHQVYGTANSTLAVDRQNYFPRRRYKNLNPNVYRRADWTLWNFIPEEDKYRIQFDWSPGLFWGLKPKEKENQIFLTTKEDATLFKLEPFGPNLPEPINIKTIPIPGEEGQYILDLEDISLKSWVETLASYGNGINVKIGEYSDWEIASAAKAESIAKSFKDSGNKLPEGMYLLQSIYDDGWKRFQGSYPYWEVLIIESDGDTRIRTEENFLSNDYKVILWRKEGG